MRTYLLTMTSLVCLLGVPEAKESGRRFLDLVAYYPVVVEGKVLRVVPQYSMTGAAGYWTLLELRASSYLRGDGPDTIRVQLRWINSDSIATFSSDGRALAVPQAGSAAILWIDRSEYDALPPTYYPQCDGLDSKPLFAELSSDLQVWSITADSLPALGCSLNDGLRLISSAVDSASISSQLRAAAHIVLGRWRSHASCVQSSEMCTTISVAGILRGQAIADSVISIRLDRKLPRSCYQTTALYPLLGPDSSGVFRPVHRNWPCFPVVDGEVIVDYRMVPGKPIDCLAPVRALIEDLVSQ